MKELNISGVDNSSVNAKEEAFDWLKLRNLIKENDEISPPIHLEIHFKNRVGRTVAGGITTMLTRLFMVLFVISQILFVVNRNEPYFGTSYKMMEDSQEISLSNLT